MRSDEDAVGVADGLGLETGQQALLSIDSMQSPLRELPPSAYANLLVVASTTPATVAGELSAAGADLRTVGQIPISGSESNYDGPMWTCDPLVPDDLTGLSMRLSRGLDALGAGRGWVLFENLNVFLLYASEDRVVRFLDHAATLARERDIRGVYALVRDAVDDETYARLRRTVDVERDCR
ncbi:hypothetical protein KTS45_01280 [Halomicroarcula limicola]|uniref:Uncharacterized protein n=1 Tax=Haloarcula limicola TaxID=1429915 RepID=A0A8J7Y2H3_9EURY|nr:hypothetical protein [Halomicroarcula limicola]MBV0922822.1 hypothetical protein [Halomicroarcula limicola]